MQLWSPSVRAFVDVVDLYPYLPFIRPRFLESYLDDLSGEELSILLHEFTHLVSLGGYFGLLQTYHLAKNRTFRDNCQSAAQAACRLGKISKEEVKDVSWKVYASVDPDSIQIYEVITSAYRWLFEGLALFVELDCICHLSRSRGAASNLWCFLFSLSTRTKWQKWRQNTTNAPALSPDPAKIIEEFIDKIAPYQREINYKRLIFTDCYPNTRVYFAGYLLVKGLHKHLAQLDPRLSDPETFLIFALGYFFNDYKLLDLIAPSSLVFESESILPEHNFQRVSDRVMRHLEESLAHLCKIDSAGLKRSVDPIAMVEDKKSPIWKIDYRALTTNKFSNDEMPVIKIQDYIEKLKKVLDLQCKQAADDLKENYGVSDEEAQKMQDRLIQVSHGIMDIRTSMQNILRICSFRATVFCYQRRGNLANVGILSPYNSPAFGIFTWHEAWLTDILTASNDLTNAIDLDNSEMKDILDQDDGLEKLLTLWKSRRLAGEDCNINCHFLYISTNNPLESLVFAINREDKSFVFYHNGNKAPSDEIAMPIKHCVPFFNYKLMENLLMLDDFRIDKNTVWIESLPDVADEAQTLAWRFVFPNALAGDQDLRSFWRQKLPLVQTYHVLDDLIDYLCNYGIKEMDGDQHAVVQAIEELNSSWKAYTGLPLIDVQPSADGNYRFILNW